MEWTSHFRPDFVGHLRGALAEYRRRQLVAGLVHQRAREVLALADDHAFGEGGCGWRSGRRWRGDGERLHAQVLAVAAIGVGIEVADERALDGGPAPLRGADLSELSSGRAKASSRIAARLGVADGGSRRHCAPRARSALAFLPRPTISSRFAFSPAGACSSTVSLVPALYSPLASTAAAAASDRFVAGQQDGLRRTSGPLAVCVSTAATASSSVSIWARGEKERSVRIPDHYFTAKWREIRHRFSSDNGRSRMWLSRRRRLAKVASGP